MKPLLFSGGLLLIPFFLCAQPGFNTAHDYDDLIINRFYDVVINGDTIIAYGLAQDSALPYRQGVFVARFDTFGNRLDHRLLVDTNNIYSIDKHWGKISVTSDNGYALTTSALYGRDAVFIKLDDHLGIKFVQKYMDTISGGEHLMSPIEVADGYLLYGYFNQADNGNLDALLRKVDKQGNTIWKKTWGISNWDDSFTQAYRFQDSLWLINGSKTFYNGFNSFTRPWFCVFNDAGDLKWQWTADNTLPFNGLGLGRFFPQEDGSWICYAGEDLGVDPVYGWNRYQAHWVKLDSNFNFQWSKPFGPHVYNLDRFQDILRAPNGDLIGIG
ncbi:MAG: hypothetical protein JNJ57_03140, partial [Saprospiraceae bacterium]|nr:hypothetical protein [Saprospiraceae bacterium]